MGERPPVRGRRSGCILEGCQTTLLSVAKEPGFRRPLAPLRGALRFVRQSGGRPPFAPTDHRLPSGNPLGLAEMAKRRAVRLACPFFGWQFAGRGRRDALPYV